MYILENQELGQIIAMSPHGLNSNLHGLGDISPTDYINWVKRSLNRRFGTKLSMGSSTDMAYRQAVKRFQAEVGLKASGEVDSVTQNQLIKANESDPNYMDWVQKSLNRTGAELTISRLKDKNTTATIEGFQAYHSGVYKDLKLKVDGFIGAKTETALIRSAKVFPPGQVSGGEKPVTPTGRVVPLNQSEVRDFVFSIMGKKPRRSSLLWEIYKFFEFTGLKGKPSIKTFFKVYFKTLKEQFNRDPISEIGAILGSTYAVMDAATGRSRRGAVDARKCLPIGAKNRDAFIEGYNLMESRLRLFERKPETTSKHRETLKRLNAVSNKRGAMSTIFRTLLEIYRQEGGSTITARVMEDCRFRYPEIVCCANA